MYNFLGKGFNLFKTLKSIIGLNYIKSLSYSFLVCGYTSYNL